MNEKVTFYSHSCRLFAFFVLGNAVTVLPVSNADSYTFLGYVLSAAVLFLLFLVLYPLCLKLFCDGNKKGIAKILQTAVYAAAMVFAVFCLGDAFSSFIYISARLLLPEASNFAVIVILLAVTAYFGSKRQENVLKFALVAFPFCLVIILFFFLASAGEFNWRSVFVFSPPSFKNLLEQTYAYLKNPVSFCLLLPVYEVLFFKNRDKRPLFAGTLTGFLLLALCLLNSLLLFGPNLSGKLDFAYCEAVSSVSVGRLFTRLDGFAYLIFFVSILLRITVCVFIIKTLLKRLYFVLQKNKKRPVE